MTPKEIDKLHKAGQIAVQVKAYAKSIVKKNVLLVEIADKIEDKIIELGGKLAFPVNLGINEMTAHYTPMYNDDTKAEGLLKIDFGVHVDGFIADTAFSIDLENKEENKKLIECAEHCVANAIRAVEQNKTLGEIGEVIQKTAEKNNFSPIQNLSGHEIGQYHLHGGITIPNYNNENQKNLNDGIYAIEPFVTTGQGLVYDGRLSGIYKVERSVPIRDNNAREIFNYILEEYKTLPFCSRWLVKKFGPRAVLSLRLIEQAGALHQYPQLIEQSRKPVAQAEHTLIIDNGKVKVITE